MLTQELSLPKPLPTEVLGPPPSANADAIPFLEWSESEIGFYPGTIYRNGGWWPWDGPVVWPDAIRAVLRWLFTPVNGRLPIDSLYWIDVKKSGKTLLAAALGQWFATNFDAGIRGEIAFAANSITQADVRCFASLLFSIEKNQNYLHDMVYSKTTTEVVFRNPLKDSEQGHIARPHARNAATQSGINPLYINFDEPHYLTGEAAHLFVAEMARSYTRNMSFQLFTSYPGHDGDGSVLTSAIASFFDEDERPLPGVEKVPGLEAFPLWIQGRTAMWWNHNALLYPWVTQEILDEIREDHKIKGLLSEYRRMYEARITQSEDAFVLAEVWRACRDDDWTGLGPDDRDVPMVLGLDLGTRHDSCGLTGRGYDIDTGRMPLMLDKCWKPKDYRKNGKVGYILTDVEQYILDLNDRQKILALYLDERDAVQMSENLKRAGVKVIAVGQNAERETADTAYKRLIIDQKLRNYRHCGQLSDQVLNAVAVFTGNESRIRIRKDKTTKLIDMCVADSMCCFGVVKERMAFERYARRGRMVEPRKKVNKFKKIYGLGN